MTHSRLFLLCLPALCFVTHASAQIAASAPLKVASPNGQIVLLLSDSTVGPATDPSSTGMHYAVDFHGKWLMDESMLGLKIQGQPALGPGMKQVHAESGHVDESYTIPVGKTKNVEDRYNSTRVDFEDPSGRKLTVEVRAFDDGVAFRYIVPQQASFKNVRIEHELTEFRYSKDATLYPLILDGFQSSWEDEYQMRNVSGIHRDWVIGLPLLGEVPGVGWVAVTEADIDNYAGMYMRKAEGPFALRAELSPRVDQPGVAVEAETPVTTPWRVLMIGDAPGRLIESNIVLNLNPPSKIADTSWIRARQIGVGLVVGRGRSERELQDRHEHRDHEALHRLRIGVRFSLHADRCGLGSGQSQGTAGLLGAGRHHPRDAGNRHAGVAALRQREECPAVAVVALDLRRQIHGPGVSAVREVGHRRRQDRLHESRRSADGRLLSSRGRIRSRSIIS